MKGKRVVAAETDDARAAFGPPVEPVPVHCIHCKRTYSSDRIRWDPVSEMWLCPVPGCDGAGFGFDIHETMAGRDLAEEGYTPFEEAGGQSMNRGHHDGAALPGRGWASSIGPSAAWSGWPSSPRGVRP
jgi:hypothetical protein